MISRKLVLIKILLIVLVFCSQSLGDTSNGGSVEQEFQKEMENQKKVSEYFVENIFPASARKKGLKFSVFHIKKTMYESPWIEGLMLSDVKQCTNLYLIDVNDETESKYFFCLLDSKVDLIAHYEYKGKWIKVKDTHQN